VEWRGEINSLIMYHESTSIQKTSTGRENTRWMDVVKQDLKQLKLNVKITEDRAEWRRRTCVADPSPECEGNEEQP